VPSGAAVLRRALVLWGTGHLALGDRRGWLLLLIQPLAIGGLVAVGVLVLQGSRWIALFPALALLIAVWLGQAMHAHRLAIRSGGAPGGEFQIVLALPLVVVLLSGFWLVGGSRSSPAAAVQHYVAAWQAGKPADAALLFAEPIDASALDAGWRAQRSHVEQVVRDAARRYGAQSGLDPEEPFNSLRFEVSSTSADRAVVQVEVVRRRRVETSLFGIIPTATQETVLVERLGEISLRARTAPLPDWLPLRINPGRLWLIDEVTLATGAG
jgi:hypothetical protein